MSQHATMTPKSPLSRAYDGSGASTRQRPLTTHPSYLRVVSGAQTPRTAPPAPAPRRHRRARHSGPTRLTTRGRLVVAIVAALAAAAIASILLALAAGWLGSSAGASPQVQALPTASASARSILVKPGDTLWSIAKALRPGVSTWETVRLLREVNGLRDSLIRPGDLLVVPAAVAS